MKAAFLRSINSKWEIREIQTPTPSPNQVLIKMNASGLCYTDVHITKGEWFLSKNANNDLHQLQFLYLTTNGRKTARQYTIEIWFIEYNTRYYIISEHKKSSDWVKNIIFNPNVTFDVNNKTYKGYARVVDKSKEPILANAVSDLMFSKYRWNDGLIVELTSKDNKL